MHKASTQSFTTAYDACTIIMAEMAFAVVAVNCKVSPDMLQSLSLPTVVLFALNVTAAH